MGDRIARCIDCGRCYAAHMLQSGISPIGTDGCTQCGSSQFVQLLPTDVGCDPL